MTSFGIAGEAVQCIRKYLFCLLIDAQMWCGSVSCHVAVGLVTGYRKCSNLAQSSKLMLIGLHAPHAVKAVTVWEQDYGAAKQQRLTYILSLQKLAHQNWIR